MQLPGSMVVESNVKEGGFLAAAATYTVSFNEPMTLDSMQKSGVVQVTRMDTNAEIPVTVTADTQVNSAAEKFGLVFERVSGVTYKVAINGAFNLRGTGQWAEFVEHFTQANELAIQPVINTVENGSYHRDNQQAIRILGTGFRNSADVKVFVDQFPVSVHWVNDQLIEIPANALILLPLAIGQHHIKVQDHELEAQFLGAVVTGAELNTAQFNVSPCYCRY